MCVYIAEISLNLIIRNERNFLVENAAKAALIKQFKSNNEMKVDSAIAKK